MGEVVDILLNAKDKIIDGWVPHIPTSGNEVCAKYAIGEAAFEICGSRRDQVRGLEMDAGEYLRSVIGTKSIPKWNDSQTDKQVVIDAFDAAIRLAKQREL